MKSRKGHHAHRHGDAELRDSARFQKKKKLPTFSGRKGGKMKIYCMVSHGVGQYRKLSHVVTWDNKTEFPVVGCGNSTYILECATLRDFARTKKNVRAFLTPKQREKVSVVLNCPVKAWAVRLYRAA